ncbi:MAG: DUF370 domain-containing protein [Bacillaceae bacterium]|nr:DUF370 domain-containing protein [Bacillaceae bacterium]
MLIHIGGDIIVNSSEVVMILDNQTADLSRMNQKFLDENKLVNPSLSNLEEIKSYVITTDEIYASSISSSTLKRRSNLSHSLEGR